MRHGLSPARAASILHVHRNTVYGWAMCVVEGRRSRLTYVERHPITGRLSIAREDVQRIQRLAADDYDEDDAT